MQLSKEMLVKLIKEEMKLFKGAKKVEDVKAKEVDADEFGSDKALEKPEERDHNVEESYNVIRALNSEERRLQQRIKKIREQKVLHAKKLIQQ